jgi:circadian clock protein KaiC
LAALGCTCLLLSDQDIHYQHPIEMHVDGIFRLEEEHVGARDIRYFHVQKLRGRGFLRGRHAMEITDAGIEIYPRLEAIRTERPLAVTEGRDRKPFGVKGLDGMLRGGLVAGSTTMLLGAPGAGKTVLALHFLGEGLNKGEPALFVGFNESPDQLMAKAESVALGLRSHYDAGKLRVIWNPPLELLIDAWSHEVLHVAQEHRPTRIVIDGLSDVERQEFFIGRLPTLLAALANEFGHMNITTLLTAENKGLVGSSLDVTLPAPSAVVENVIMLRYVEVASQLHRLISVLKVRESDHDTSIREFSISRQGLEVSHTFESAEAVLAGSARSQPPVSPRGV